MNKLSLVLCLFISIFSIAYLQHDKGGVSSVKNVPLGKYELTVCDAPIKPSITLKENDEFEFVFSVFSSRLVIGKYVVNNDKVTLYCNDTEDKYVFEINDNSLVFNEKESSSIPYAEIFDGAIFERLQNKSNL